MVGILLIILKVLGIILLSVITFLILIILIILFAPIRYQAEGGKDEEVTAAANITWLLRIIKIEILYDKDIKYRVKILWKVIMQEGYKKEEHTKVKKQKKQLNKKSDKHIKDITKTEIKRHEEDNNILKNEENKPNSDNDSNINKIGQENKKVIVRPLQEHIKESSYERTENVRESINAEELTKTEETKIIKETQKIKESKTTKDKKNTKKSFKVRNKVKVKKKDNEKQNKNDKLSKGKDIFNKIRDFYNDESYKGVIKFIWKHLKKVLKSVLPKKTKIELEYGLDDPMMTGLSLGAISIFYAVLGNSMVIKPDFNRQMIKGKFYVKGRIYLFIIAYHAILVILDKRVRKLKSEFI